MTEGTHPQAPNDRRRPDARGRARDAEAITGVGLGLRWEFIDDLLTRAPAIDFLEVSPENYVGRGGYFDAALERVLARWPLVTHGLTMSLGGFDPIPPAYLDGVARFCERVKTPWHSDHLCFGVVDDVYVHDLLPVAFKTSEVARIADRIKRAQDVLRRPMAIENVSFYMHPGKREMSEAEFIARVCDAADCGLMLDVNNAWVNATNFGYDVDAWMRTVPLDRVVQMHVAGHDWFTEDTWEPAERPSTVAERRGKLIVDTHGAPCEEEVLALLERTLEKTGEVPVLLERDQSIPSLDALLDEVAVIKKIWTRATARKAERA